MKDGNVVETRNLCKDYYIAKLEPSEKNRLNPFGNKFYRRVLSNIDLDVGKGDVLGIVGPNGSGKSTLLKILSDVLQPSDGSIETKGKIASILEMGVGFHPDINGKENVVYRNELNLVSRRDTEDIMDEILRFTDIGDWAERPVKLLSNGMRMRLAFGATTFVDADIYILDEPLAAGDYLFALKALQRIASLKETGKTVIFSSHRLDVVEKLCTRTLWIERGKIVMVGNPAEVCQAYRDDTKKNPASVEILADYGNPEYMAIRSEMIEKGLSEGDVTELLRGSAKKGYVPALLKYADMLLGEGKKEEATETLGRACDLGSTEAVKRYANLCDAGVEEIRESAAGKTVSGNAEDLFRYAKTLESTAYRSADYGEALKIYTETSARGHGASAYASARLYLEGNGTEKDVGKYLELLRESAESGYAEAISELAETVSEGKLTGYDENEAFYWHLKAAENGCKNSQFKVHRMYVEGVGTGKNPEKAAEWLTAYRSAR